MMNGRRGSAPRKQTPIYGMMHGGCVAITSKLQFSRFLRVSASN